MSEHYTSKFKAAFDRVVKIATEEGMDAARVAFRDEMLKLGHEERIRNLYRIQDKLTKQPKFFKPNAAQEKFLKTKGKRNIILKCRQVGFTTLNCIRALDLALWESNTRTGILCHKLSTVKTIFNDITKFSYNWFIRDWGKWYKPKQKTDSATALSFEHDGLGRPLESSIIVLHDFRGKTLHFLHVSEAARIEDDRLVGSVNGVPDNGEITYESTAHGRSGEFFRLWSLWRAKGKDAPAKGFFVPWYVHYPEQPEEWSDVSDMELTPRELELLESYKGKIDKVKLRWRRWAIEAKCNGSEERFENEYPTNDIDCFMTSEYAVFPHSVLKYQLKHVKEPFFKGFLLANGNRMEVHEDPKGVVSIWESPEPDRTYFIGADPAGGVGKDKGAAYVIDGHTGKIVARIWGDMLPADFARELYKLARFYNNAFICVEVNNHGHVVIHVLTKELNYRNLYKRRSIDEISQKPTNKLGFHTTNENKILITEKLKTAVKTGKLIIPDADLINEMTTFIQEASKSGASVRRHATQGAHDDLVMAAAFAVEMQSTRALPTQEEESFSINELNIDPETGFLL